MGNTHSTVTIDEFKKHSAKKLGYNISKILDNALTAILCTKLQGDDVDLMKLSDDIEKVKATLIDNQILLDSLMSKKLAIENKVDKESEDKEKAVSKLVSGLKASGYVEDI